MKFFIKVVPTHGFKINFTTNAVSFKAVRRKVEAMFLRADRSLEKFTVSKKPIDTFQEHLQVEHLTIQPNGIASGFFNTMENQKWLKRSSL